MTTVTGTTYNNNTGLVGWKRVAAIGFGPRMPRAISAPYSNVASATTLSRHHAPHCPVKLSGHSRERQPDQRLSWTASTDNMGVTGYQVERCQGAGCSSFSQIAHYGNRERPITTRGCVAWNELQLPRPCDGRREATSVLYSSVASAATSTASQTPRPPAAPCEPERPRS